MDFNLVDFSIALVGSILLVGVPMFLLIRKDAKERTREEWNNRLALASENPPAESWEEVRQRKLNRSASHGRTEGLKDTPILSMTKDQLFEDVMGLSLEDITRPGYPIEYPIHVFIHYLQAFFILAKKMDERITYLELSTQNEKERNDER